MVGNELGCFCHVEVDSSIGEDKCISQILITIDTRKGLLEYALSSLGKMGSNLLNGRVEGVNASCLQLFLHGNFGTMGGNFVCENSLELASGNSLHSGISRKTIFEDSKSVHNGSV